MDLKILPQALLNLNLFKKINKKKKEIFTKLYRWDSYLVIHNFLCSTAPINVSPQRWLGRVDTLVIRLPKQSQPPGI